MELSEFIVAVLNNLTNTVIIFISLLIIYYFLFKKTFVNRVDSFVVELITCTGSAATVAIMYINHVLKNKFFISFITTEIALFAGIYIMYWLSQKVRKLQSEPEDITLRNRNYLTIFCYVTSIVYLIVQLISFIQVGFVLFNKTEGVNHVNAYAENGVLFGFVLSITPLYLTSLFIKRKVFNKFSFYDYFCLSIVIISSLGSGSKSSFVALFTAFTFVDYKFAKLFNKPKTKIPLIYIFVFVLSVIAIIALTSLNTENPAYLGLFERVLFSGDVFLLGYNDSAVNYVVKGKTAFTYIFYPFYGKFTKLVGINMVPENIGVGLYDYTYGITTSGSTSRHNYLAYIFWGEYWGWLLSLLIGLFIGFVRFCLFEITRTKNIFYFILVCTIVSIVPICITDIYLFNYLLFMICFQFILISITTLFIYEFVTYKPKSFFYE